MIGLYSKVKCKNCKRQVPFLYYDSNQSGLICETCHREMIAYRLRLVNHFKHLESDRWACGQCKKLVSHLFYDRVMSRFICSDCEGNLINGLSAAA